MTEYTLSSCAPMGARDEKYGQAFWAEALESQVPLMFNSMEDIAPGDKISFESMEPKTSKKGKDYMRLKKVRRVGGGAKPSSASPDKLDYIIEMLEELTDRREPKADKEMDTAKEVEQAMEDEIDLSDVPF